MLTVHDWVVSSWRKNGTPRLDPISLREGTILAIVKILCPIVLSSGNSEYDEDNATVS